MQAWRSGQNSETLGGPPAQSMNPKASPNLQEDDLAEIGTSKDAPAGHRSVSFGDYRKIVDI